MKLSSLAATLAVANCISLGWDQVFGDSVPSRIVKTGPNEFQLVSENDKLRAKRNGVKFIDVTATMPMEDAVTQGLITNAGTNSVFTIFAKQIAELKAPLPSYEYPKKAAYQEVVRPLLDQINIDGVKANMAAFTSFYTRYYKSETGVDSANWLHKTVSETVQNVPGATVTKIKHDGWDQYSIVVSIAGKSEDKVVVGAHQDSMNLLFPNLLRAPGADDDGSGTVTTLEALRLVSQAIVAGDFTPYNTLEFHYYSAEEGGLLGSMDVFGRYMAANATVVGMLQQDMTGYTQGSMDAGVAPHLGLVDDYTSANQNEFIKVVAEAYSLLPVHTTQCGYACSDHASALEHGFPGSFVIESEFKYTAKQIHSTFDTMDRLDFGHIEEHIKLTVGYAVELAGAKELY